MSSKETSFLSKQYCKRTIEIYFCISFFFKWHWLLFAIKIIETARIYILPRYLGESATKTARAIKGLRWTEEPVWYTICAFMHSRACHSDGRISAKSRCHRYRDRPTTAIHRDKVSQSSRAEPATGWQIGGRPTWQLTPIRPFYSDKSRRYISLYEPARISSRHTCYFCVASPIDFVPFYRGDLLFRCTTFPWKWTSPSDFVRELFTFLYRYFLFSRWLVNIRESLAEAESKRWKNKVLSTINKDRRKIEV